MLFNTTCNTTLEDMRISSGSEKILVGPLNFHDLARIIAASCTLVAVAMSLYLIWMHALHYTQPREQRYIIRILFMVPVYAISSFLSIQWYWHAVYFQVISDCYEAFAIASFFALICHYVAPDLHSQKAFFREMRPVKPWVLPINWFAKCCGGQRGIWRTPKSGLTWFNIIWIGVYHYCFIRVVMTIAAVVSQHFKRYCESSNSPVFGHIWTIVLNAAAVTIAMYCLIQFYIQLKGPLSEQKLFLKIVAIKLVVFLSFWQASAISVGTSTLKIVHPNEVLAYPDLKVGVPSLLLCVEMALFAILHLWAFPYAPYRTGAPRTYYPSPDADKSHPTVENRREAPAGGFMGLMALVDALNIWDFIKAFGRGMRWLFCGVKRRKEDISYQLNHHDGVDMDHLPEGKGGDGSYESMGPHGVPTAVPTGYDEYRPQMMGYGRDTRLAHGNGVSATDEESAGLMGYAQPNPVDHSNSSPPRRPQHPHRDHSPYGDMYPDDHSYHASQVSHQQSGIIQGQQASYYDQPTRQGPSGQPAPTQAQSTIGQALWGPGPPH